MTIDANSYCPGGTGKKIKHCDCRDIAGELEKIGKALEGGQRVAALDRINRALATKAHRPCLLALKASTLVQMNELQSFEDTVTTFVKVAPQNALAHCYASTLESRKSRMREAVDALQSAFDCLGEGIPGEIVMAMAQLVNLLVQSHEFLSARAHTVLLNLLAPDDRLSQQAIMALSGMQEIPLVLKSDRAFMDCPDGASWRSRFDAAQDDALGMRWRKALGKYERLNEEFPQTPAILWNMALLRSLLALPHQAEAWRAFAQCPGTQCPGADLERAIDAESVAQTLRYNEEQPEVALMRWTAQVADANELNGRLLSTPGLVSIPLDPRLQGRENEPPPKGAFTLLDRPALADDVEVTSENVPQRLATLMLYGRETDRPARLSAVLVRTESYDSSLVRLNEIGGTLFTDERQEEVIEMMPRLMIEIDPTCHFPITTRFPVRQRVTSAVTQKKFLERWPRVPLPCLGGKSPAEVAADPAWRVPLEAAFVGLESFTEVNRLNLDVDAVRQSLGLPIPDPIVPTGKGDEVLVSNLHRVDPEQLDDDLLSHLYDLARVFAAHKASLRFGNELLRRGDKLSATERYQVLFDLAQNVGDRETAVAHLTQARKEATSANLSPAAALLAELPLRLLNSEVAEAQDILGVLQTKHIREPGVAEALYQVLREFGIIRDEQMRSMEQPEMAATPNQPPAPDAGSALWTPDAPPPSDQGERPSKLWLPD